MNADRPFVRREAGLVFGLATMGIFQLFGTPWVSNLDSVAKGVGLFVWLFFAILALSFGVVRHADCLAVLLGEPYGTLILTLSVIGIEAAMMAQLMLNGEDSPTLARDTMFSVLMIVLTGIVGVTLLVGGVFNPEQQEYNLSGALSYLRVLTPMAILSLVVPRFTRKDGGEIWGPLGVWLVCMSGSLYGVFLYHQTKTHSFYFDQPPERQSMSEGDPELQRQLPPQEQPPNLSAPGATAAHAYEQQQLETPGKQAMYAGHDRRRDRRGSIGVVAPVVVTPTHGHDDMEIRTTRYHTFMLFATMLPVVLLAKYMSKMIKYVITETRMPQELGGFLVAVLILSPESLTAVKAALAPNQLQRTVNIALGSATSTIGMTVCTVAQTSLRLLRLSGCMFSITGDNLALLGQLFSTLP